MSDRLAKLEARIEQLVEGTLSRLLAGRLQTREVAVRLARAMEDHAVSGPGGSLLAPAAYRVRLNPDDAIALHASSTDLTAELAAELVLFARELDLDLPGAPIVLIEPDSSVELNGVMIEPAGDPHNVTRPMPAAAAPRAGGPETRPDTPKAQPAKSTRAFLIVEGQRHVPLDRAVVSLGRRLDNTVIVDDPGVSRHHAQLRQRYGKWVLYDLGSAGGTIVNNQRVEEHLLRAGDVISLAGAKLIYGEEETQPGVEDTGETRPLPARRDAELPLPKLTTDSRGTDVNG